MTSEQRFHRVYDVIFNLISMLKHPNYWWLETLCFVTWMTMWRIEEVWPVYVQYRCVGLKRALIGVLINPDTSKTGDFQICKSGVIHVSMHIITLPKSIVHCHFRNSCLLLWLWNRILWMPKVSQEIIISYPGFHFKTHVNKDEHKSDWKQYFCDTAEGCPTIVYSVFTHQSSVVTTKWHFDEFKNSFL